MRLRRYRPEDFATLQGWIADRREHALWCADRFSYPLAQEDFHRVLAAAAVEAGETPFILCDDGGLALGFVCYSQDNGVGKLRFVILAPALRGKGLGKMLLNSALGYAFGAAGAEAVRLSVFPENVRAMACYERIGFRAIMTAESIFPFLEERWGRCIMEIRRGT